MKLTLNSGREIRLTKLQQSETYYGVLCGVPRPDINAQYIATALLKVQQLTELSIKPFLVPPPEGVWLPKVTTFAEFDSGELARPGSEVYSSMLVVWHQEAFGLPDERILAALSDLDWEAEAVDWGW